MKTYLTILFLATAVAATGIDDGLGDQLPTAKSFVVWFFEWFGELGIFCGRLVRAALTPPYEGRELIRQLDEVGSKSFLLVALAGSATGVVLSLDTTDALSQFGAKSMLPAVVIFSILPESGPIITGLIVSGR